MSRSNMVGGTLASSGSASGLALRQPGVEARRSGQRPSQAGNDQHHTGVSEARTSLLLLYIIANRPKDDLSQPFQTLQDGVSPDSSRPGLDPERPERARGLLPPKPVPAGVGRSRSTQFRWKSLLEGPLPEARRRSVWLWTAAGRPRRAYFTSTEE